MSFSPEVAALVEQREVGCALLVYFDFVSGAKRVFTGFGNLVTLDGNVWEGLGEIGRIEGISPALSGSAPPGRMIASGVSPEMLRIASSEAGEFVNRLVIIYLQLFDQRRLYGMPEALATRVMKSMEVTRDRDQRSIVINHESPYERRNRPAGGYYSDRDQQTRFAGDKFCERVPLLAFKKLTWPDYAP